MVGVDLKYSNEFLNFYVFDSQTALGLLGT